MGGRLAACREVHHGTAVRHGRRPRSRQRRRPHAGAGARGGARAAAELLAAARRDAAVPWRSSAATPGRPGRCSRRPRRPGFASAGVDVQRARRRPDARRRARLRARRRRPRRSWSARQPQPDARQRAQAVRPRRPQAARRRRGRHRARGLGDTPRAPDRARASAASRDRHGASSSSYVDHLLATLPAPLAGLKVVVDCAQGAASRARARRSTAGPAPTVVAIAARRRRRAHQRRRPAPPTSSLLQAAVRRARRRPRPRPRRRRRPLPRGRRRPAPSSTATRCWRLLAVGLHERGALPTRHRRRHRDEQPRASHQAMTRAGIAVVQTAVGDRYVLEAMRAGGHALGGEQTGHLVLARPRHHRRRAAHRAERARPDGRDRPSLAELAAVVTRLPQVLVNVPGRAARGPRRRRRSTRSRTRRAQLGDAGRVLLRPSGTEPLVRVMVEAETAERADEVAPGSRRSSGASGRSAAPTTLQPVKNLTRDEAGERAALLDVRSYDVALDLTGGPERLRQRERRRLLAAASRGRRPSSSSTGSC